MEEASKMQQPLAAAGPIYQNPNNPQPAPIASTTVTTKTKKVVSFSPTLTETHPAPDYDRTGIPTDSICCDVCGGRIPGGIRGYEVYGTCLICNTANGEGYDVCGPCCGTTKIVTLCQTKHTFLPPPLDQQQQQQQQYCWPLRIKIKHHQHALHVVDRGAEVLWANDKYYYKHHDHPKQASRKRTHAAMAATNLSIDNAGMSSSSSSSSASSSLLPAQGKATNHAVATTVLTATVKSIRIGKTSGTIKVVLSTTTANTTQKPRTTVTAKVKAIREISGSIRVLLSTSSSSWATTTKAGR